MDINNVYYIYIKFPALAVRFFTASTLAPPEKTTCDFHDKF